MAAYGYPKWGGSAPVAETSAYLAAKYGAWISSRKRARNHPLSISNPSSDHNEANTASYAMDFATFNGAPLAHAIARHFGIQGYSTGNYTKYVVHRGGATFLVQILWAVQGHFNHVHLGVKHIGGEYKDGPEYYTHKPKLPKILTNKEVELSNKLRYHRYLRAKEARTGKGKRWQKHDNWCKYWYHEIEKHKNKLKGNLFKRKRRREALRNVLNHKFDYERRKK